MSQKKSKSELAMLIIGTRNKEQGSFELLLKSYSPLIESCVNFYSVGNLEKYRDDFRQEATVAFYNSILTYNLEQTAVEFGLYAKICICNALNSQIRLSKRLSNETLQDSFDDLNLIDGDENPSSKLLENERLEHLFNIIRSTLSPYEYRIWKLYLSGYSVSEIANQLETDSKSVSNAVYRIRVKLKSSIKRQRND